MGATAFAIVNGGVGVVAFRAMVADGTGVTVVKVSAMGPAVVVVGIFARGSGRGRFAIGAVTAFAIGLPRLLDDGVFDDVNQRLGINGATCKCLGINDDGLGGVA